jgi:hypothetical protein
MAQNFQVDTSDYMGFKYEEYLNPILEKLSLTNLSLEYLQDKLDIIRELENDEPKNYYEEFKNICLFIKNQLEENKIELSKNKINELSELINKSIVLIESNDENINWENELNTFNQKCEDINNF